jgi:hypothetical protein
MLLPDRRGPPIGLPPDLVWLPDLVRLKPGWSCVRGCQRVRDKRPRRVRRKAALAWPRRERDVAALVCGHRTRQGRGGVVAWLRRWWWRDGGGAAISVGRGSGHVGCVCVGARGVLGSQGRGSSPAKQHGGGLEAKVRLG